MKFNSPKRHPGAFLNPIGALAERGGNNGVELFTNEYEEKHNRMSLKKIFEVSKQVKKFEKISMLSK